MGKPKYVPSELVASIDTEAVRLTIGKDELERLEVHAARGGRSLGLYRPGR